jgi:hypothetical protein
MQKITKVKSIEIIGGEGENVKVTENPITFVDQNDYVCFRIREFLPEIKKSYKYKLKITYLMCGDDLNPFDRVEELEYMELIYVAKVYVNESFISEYKFVHDNNRKHINDRYVTDNEGELKLQRFNQKNHEMWDEYKMLNKTVKEIKEKIDDKKNIEALVSATEDTLKQKAVDMIDNKFKPKITVSARIDTVDLHCKKCGAHLINLIPKQYSPYRNDGKNNDKDMPAIKYDIVSENSVCDQCGCNLFNADIKIAIEPIKSSTFKIDIPMTVTGK